MGEMLRKDQAGTFGSLQPGKWQQGHKLKQGDVFLPLSGGVRFLSWRGWLLEWKEVVDGSPPKGTGLRWFQLARTIFRKSFPENLRLVRQVGQGLRQVADRQSGGEANCVQYTTKPHTSR